jgi:hypothetical protein
MSTTAKNLLLCQPDCELPERESGFGAKRKKQASPANAGRCEAQSRGFRGTIYGCREIHALISLFVSVSLSFDSP